MTRVQLILATASLLPFASFGCGASGGMNGPPATTGTGGTVAPGTGGTSGGGTGGTSGGGTGGISGGGTGGSPGTGGRVTDGGAADGGDLPMGNCTFTVSTNQVSAKMATVGVVEWSVAGEAPTSAKIVYQLKNAGATVLNTGGEAPVNLTRPNFHTLLLGLKQAQDYTFHIEATRGGSRCVSPDYTLPKTGTLAGAPKITANVMAAAKRARGFILAGTGISGVAAAAIIIDSDGEIVWSAPAPNSVTRVQMDYEGDNVWMMANNVQNSGGEMRYLSLDGQQGQQNIAGLTASHHDFTVMPGGKVVAMVWVSSGRDPESNLVIRTPDGKLTTAFRIGANLYASSTFHCNAIHYLPADDSFTISDRNPNLVIKVSAAGALKWQIGGSCTNAPAGNRCSPQTWKVNHGHHLLDDGTFLIFNNGTAGNSHVWEFKVNATDTTLNAMLVKDYTGTSTSMVLGDVQRLPNGNTLIMYSTSNVMVEVDPTWNVVQTLSGAGGYATFRTTMYGPPERL